MWLTRHPRSCFRRGFTLVLFVAPLGHLREYSFPAFRRNTHSPNVVKNATFFVHKNVLLMWLCPVCCAAPERSIISTFVALLFSHTIFSSFCCLSHGSPLPFNRVAGGGGGSGGGDNTLGDAYDAPRPRRRSFKAKTKVKALQAESEAGTTTSVRSAQSAKSEASESRGKGGRRFGWGRSAR